MATPTSTNLADILIEAGFEPSIALRATQMIEQNLSPLAKQAKVDLRFDAIDQELKAIHKRFDDPQGGVDQNESVDQHPTSHQEAIARSFEETTEAITRSIEDTTEAITRSFEDTTEAITNNINDHKENTDRCFQGIDRRLNILIWMVGLTITTNVGMLIAILIELLSR